MADKTEESSSKNEEITDSMASNEDEGEVYEVEKIIGMCNTKDGPLYKVRWLGYGPSFDTFEPAENLESCKDLIQKYLTKIKKQSEKEERQKGSKKSQQKKPTSQRKNPPKGTGKEQTLDKDVYTAESSEGDINKDKAPGKKAAKGDAKKQTWFYVSSSDDEADTLKDKFWRNLEQGIVKDSDTDLYSKIKGTGRSSKPQSFKEMYKHQPLKYVEMAKDDPEPKRRKSTEEKTKGKRKRSQSAKKPTSTSTSKPAAEDSSSICSEVDATNQATKKRRKSIKKQDSKDSTKESSSAATKSKSKSRTKQSEAATKDDEMASSDVKEEKDMKEEGASEREEESLDVAMEMVDCDGSELVRQEMDMMTEGLQESPKKEDKQGEIERAKKLFNAAKSPPHLQPVVALQRLDKGTPKAEESSPETSVEASECSNDSHVSGQPKKKRTASTESTDVDANDTRLEEEKMAKSEEAPNTESGNREEPSEPDLMIIDPPPEAQNEAGSYEASEETNTLLPANMPNLQELQENMAENSNPEQGSFNSPPVLDPQESAPIGSPKSGGVTLKWDSLMVTTNCDIAPISTDCAVVVSAGAMDTAAHNTECAVVGSGSTASMMTVAPSPSRFETPTTLILPPASSQQQQPQMSHHSTQQNATTTRTSSMDDSSSSAQNTTAETSLSSVPSTAAANNATSSMESHSTASESSSQMPSTALSSMQNTVYSAGNVSSAGSINTNGKKAKDKGSYFSRGSPPRRRAALEYYNGFNNNNQGEENFSIDLHEAGSPTVEKLRQGTVMPEDRLELDLNQWRHAVMNNEYNKVYRALSQKKYDLEQLDRASPRLIMLAAERGYDDMLELLVKSGGASVNAQTENGTTALHIACTRANKRCTIELLISLGANVNTCNNDGDTPLIAAVKRNQRVYVDLLLRAGCNIGSPNGDEDNTPLNHARALGTTNIYYALKEYEERLTAELEKEANKMLPTSASLSHTLFPLQVFNLRENTRFSFTFRHELQPTDKGMGMLLFIGNTLINSSVVRCRLYGACAVNSVLLNGHRLTALTEDGYFISSFAPLLNGTNRVEIYTCHAPDSKAKLMVSAYKAKMMR